MNKNYSIYFFRIISTLFVIGIHSFGFYSVSINTYTILMSFFSLAVPFFFLTSGYFMYISLNRRDNIKEKQLYLFKYLFNLLIVYFICTLIDGLFIYFENYYLLNIKVDILRWIFSKETLLGLHTGGYFYPIWFLIALIHSHLIIYLFKNKLKVVVSISLAIYILLYILQVIKIIDISRNVFSIGLFFTSLGYLIGIYKKELIIYLENKSKNVFKLIYLIILILLILEVDIIYFNINTTLSSYLSLILLTPLTFIILIKNPNIFKNKNVEVLGSNTFGVYLLHSFILRVIYLILNHYDISQYFISNIVIFSIFIITVYIISYILYYSPIYIFNKLREKLKY